MSFTWNASNNNLSPNYCYISHEPEIQKTDKSPCVLLFGGVFDT